MTGPYRKGRCVSCARRNRPGKVDHAVSPDTHCLFGDDAGMPWAHMSVDKLENYERELMLKIDDPEFLKHSAHYQRCLNGLRKVLNDRFAQETRETTAEELANS